MAYALCTSFYSFSFILPLLFFVYAFVLVLVRSFIALCGVSLTPIQPTASIRPTTAVAIWQCRPEMSRKNPSICNVVRGRGIFTHGCVWTRLDSSGPVRGTPHRESPRISDESHSFEVDGNAVGNLGEHKTIRLE